MLYSRIEIKEGRNLVVVVYCLFIKNDTEFQKLNLNVGDITVDYEIMANLVKSYNIKPT